jgi:hypothetical protein
MNANGSFYSLTVLNQPNKIRTINTKQTKYLRVVLQESHTGGKINDNIYIHCSASADHGWLLMNFLGEHHPGLSLCKAASILNL